MRSAMGMIGLLAVGLLGLEATAARSTGRVAFVGGVCPARPVQASPLWRKVETRAASSSSSWDSWGERQKSVRGGAAAGGGKPTKGFLPPVSRWHKFKSWILRSDPVYSGLAQEDYIEACRSLGVREDIDEESLKEKVAALLVKYEDDRRKKIMIEWNHDKILEHRLFMQLDGSMAMPADLDPRDLDERRIPVGEREVQQFFGMLDITPETLKKGPGAVDKLMNNKLVRKLAPKRLYDLARYAIYAFQESSGAPNLKRMLFPQSFGLLFSMLIASLLEDPLLAIIPCILANVFPTYNLGEPKKENRRQQIPIKPKKLTLIFVWNIVITLTGYALGKAWVGLKYPLFDMEPQRFPVLFANLFQWMVSSGIFVREATLAVKPGKH